MNKATCSLPRLFIGWVFSTTRNLTPLLRPADLRTTDLPIDWHTSTWAAYLGIGYVNTWCSSNYSQVILISKQYRTTIPTARPHKRWVAQWLPLLLLQKVWYWMSYDDTVCLSNMLFWLAPACTDRPYLWPNFWKMADQDIDDREGLVTSYVAMPMDGVQIERSLESSQRMLLQDFRGWY